VHGPLFRYERPQKGRYRQFHQIDAEIIGAAEPQADVELLVMADQLLKELGINDGVRLQLNTLGDTESRDAWRADLIKHFNDHGSYLSADSQARLKVNPLRILDSKDPEDQKIVQMAPGIDAYLTDQARSFFEQVQAGLKAADVDFVRNSKLVRGLDYYRHTAFEFVTARLGAQGTVLGGGRYDGLIENLGGNATPAVGWAAGIERLAMLVDLDDLRGHWPDIAIVVQSEALQNLGFVLCTEMRRRKYHAELIASGSERKRFDKAIKLIPACIVILDDMSTRYDQVGNLRVKSLGGELSECFDMLGEVLNIVSKNVVIEATLLELIDKGEIALLNGG
jgi:histidyl-tRNA synthetase